MNIIAFATAITLSIGSHDVVANLPLVVRDISTGEKIVRSYGQNVVRRLFDGTDIEFSVGPGRPDAIELSSVRKTIFGDRTRSFRRFGNAFVDERSVPFAGFSGEDTFAVRSSHAPLASNDVIVATFASRLQKLWSFTIDADGDFNDGDVIEAFVDENGSGSFEVGEPYGAAAVSNMKSSIVLDRTNPSIIRMNLLDVLRAAEPLKVPGASSSVTNAVYLRALNMTDRGLRPARYFATGRPDAIGTNTTLVSSNAVNVRILRSDVNGMSSSGGIPFDGIVIDRHLSIADHPMLTEADLVAEGQLDLDWGTLVSKVQSTLMNWREITNATYRIVVFEGTVDPKECNNNLAVTIVNNFEYGPYQSPAVPVGVSKNASRPTFSWKHENTIGKPYPAFRLRVWDSTGNTLVYDSGDVRAPARDKEGVYNWTAKDAVLTTGTSYTWGVSMLDAKFTGPLDSSREGRASFTF